MTLESEITTNRPAAAREHDRTGSQWRPWRPHSLRRLPPKKTHKADFLSAIRRQIPGPERMHPEILVRAVLSVLARHVSPGEIGDVKANLPAELRELWPGVNGHVRH